jgi:DNA-binding NarL/FixJ family response regulator
MTIEASRNATVLILHPEPILAGGLAAALRTHTRFDVQIGDSAGFYDGQSVPDVIVCDYTAGLQIAGDLRTGRRWAPCKVGVVVLSTRPRQFEVQTSLSQGVLGYLVTGCGVAELVGAVQAAYEGRRFLCHAAAQHVADGMTTEALTARERAVLFLLAKGSCNKVIANRLEIAVGTVKAHVRGIMSKLNASSRTEAANIASQRGLLDEAEELAMH